jgi:hypothetical protein
VSKSASLLAGGLSTVLALAALAAPVAAGVSATGTLAIVNGIPGGKVDICLKGEEIRSGLGYGGKVFRIQDPGDTVLKVYRADRRTCRGTLLAKGAFTLATQGDLTLVATAKAPKVVIFDNAGLGLIPPKGSPSAYAPWAWRHAADLGKVNIWFQASFYGGSYQRIQPEPYTSDVWRKGDQEISDTASAVTDYRLKATRPGKTKALATSKTIPLVTSRRFEWYLLGTTTANAKFVVFSRIISAP